MPRNIYIVFIMLCLAVAVIIGISFLNHASNKYFQLQDELNYRSRSLKYSSKKNQLDPQLNKNESLREKVAGGLKLPAISSLKTPVKLKKRSKRQVISRKSREYISWSIGLNASHYQNRPLQENEKKESELHLENEKLDVLLRIEGKTRKKLALEKIDNALVSVKAFAKSFFKNGEGNETYEEMELLELDKSEVLPTDVVEFRNAIKNFSSSSDRGRQGKFLFNIFGFGQKTKEETNTFSETEAVSINENLLGEHVKNDFTTKSSREIVTRSESSIPTITPVTNLVDLANISHFNVGEIDKNDECSDCATESLELSTVENKERSKDISNKFNIESSLPDEMLELYCLSLLNKVGESQHLSGEFVPKFATENGGNQLKSLQNLSISGSQNLLQSIEKDESSTESTVSEDSFFGNPSEFENSVSRQSKFLDFSMFGIGSGRSSIDEESHLVDGGFDSGNIEENFPSILDCENFLREKENIKMFSKPNLMDMISDPKIELQDFSNLTISPKLLQNKINNSVETFNSLKDTIEKPESVKKFNNVTKNEMLDLEKIQTTTSFLDWINASQEAITHSAIETHAVTQMQRDGRFIGMSGSGRSGIDESPESSDSRRFFTFFGSGERSLETTDFDLARNEPGSGEFDKERFFNPLGFASGGRELTENVKFDRSESIMADNECEDDCAHDITPNPSYDCNNCDYSLENNYTRGTVSKNESECDDCYTKVTHEIYRYEDEITLNLMDDCNNCNYAIENNDTRETLPKNENECDDCHPQVIHDHVYDDFQNNITEIVKFAADSVTELYRPIPSYQPEEMLVLTIIPTKSSEVYENDSFGENRVIPKGEDFKEHSNFKSTVSERESISFLGEDSSIESITLSEDRNSLHGSTPKLTNQNSEVNPKHFLGTMIFTGSGDGPITLVEETRIAPQAEVPRRGSRLLDVEDDLCDDCMVDISQMSGNKQKGSKQVDAVEHMSSSRQPTSLTDPKRFGILPENGTETAVLNQSFPSRTPTVIVSERPKILQTVFCTSARECNNALNERCVAVNVSSICTCSRGYVRHKETNKCVAIRVVETYLKYPAEEFDKDLENPFSPRYQQTKKKADDTMLLLLKGMPELLQVVTEVDAFNFKPGSLIVSYNIVFAVEKDSDEELILNLEHDLQRALKDVDINREAALDIREASVLPINSSAADPCKSSEFNYCSKNAYCVSNEAFPGRFSCYCKEHYRDVSTNPQYVGETCVDICPADYCGSNGHCEIMGNGERHCLCNGWNFGRRCEVPGIIVLSVLAVAAFISITILLMVVFRKRCSRISYGRSQETGAHLQIEGRLSDEIALGENAGSKVIKFANISTPMQQLPVLKVTHPTLNESSASYEFDSTFDVTPDRGSNPEQKSTV